MNPKLQRLVLMFLEQYADTLSSRGCNDFTFPDEFTDAEVEEILLESSLLNCRRISHEAGLRDYEEGKRDFPNRRQAMPDFSMVAYLADQLRQDASKSPTYQAYVTQLEATVATLQATCAGYEERLGAWTGAPEPTPGPEVTEPRARGLQEAITELQIGTDWLLERGSPETRAWVVHQLNLALHQYDLHVSDNGDGA